MTISHRHLHHQRQELVLLWPPAPYLGYFLLATISLAPLPSLSPTGPGCPRRARTLTNISLLLPHTWKMHHWCSVGIHITHNFINCKKAFSHCNQPQPLLSFLGCSIAHLFKFHSGNTFAVFNKRLGLCQTQVRSFLCIVESTLYIWRDSLHSSLTQHDDIIRRIHLRNVHRLRRMFSAPFCSHSLASHTVRPFLLEKKPPGDNVQGTKCDLVPWYFHVPDIWHVTNATKTWYFHVKTWLRVKRDSRLDIFTPRKSMSAPT